MRKEHLLVVDDEAHIRTSLLLLLRDAGFQVTIAQNGLEALSVLSRVQKSSEPVELILTDVRMPGMDGFGLIDELRRRQLTVPVVIITAYKNDHQTAELSKRGCFELIEKPYDPCELLERIEAVLRNQHL